MMGSLHSLVEKWRVFAERHTAAALPARRSMTAPMSKFNSASSSLFALPSEKPISASCSSLASSVTELAAPMLAAPADPGTLVVVLPKKESKPELEKGVEAGVGAGCWKNEGAGC